LIWPQPTSKKNGILSKLAIFGNLRPFIAALATHSSSPKSKTILIKSGCQVPDESVLLGTTRGISPYN
jgi:hypothetical protein